MFIGENSTQGPRVVCLLPSATEIVCALGGAACLVGRSHECDHPPDAALAPVLTAAKTHFSSSAQVDREVRSGLSNGHSLYTLDADRLRKITPDLIITQDLCRVCSIDLAAVRRVADGLQPRPAVVSLNPLTIEDVLDDVVRVGRAMDWARAARPQSGKAANETAVGSFESRAIELVARLRERMYAAMEHVNPYADGPSVAFLEWTDPLFVGGHWTPQLIERAGGRCPLNPTAPVAGAGAGAGPIGVTQRTAGPSRQFSADELIASRPDAIIISPCGLDLRTTCRETARLAEHPWWADLPAVKHRRVALVDGNQFFSRPGPRLVDAFEWLVGWLNGVPALTPDAFAWEPMH